MICEIISFVSLGATLVMAQPILQEAIQLENITSCHERDLLVKQFEELKEKSDEFWKEASDKHDRIGFPSRKPHEWKKVLNEFKIENQMINDERSLLKTKYKELTSECDRIKDEMKQSIKNRAEREIENDYKINMLQELDKIWHGFDKSYDVFKKRMAQSDDRRDAVKRREEEIMKRINFKL